MSALADAATVVVGERNPFIRYRERLDVYDAVRDGLLTDAEFIDMVDELDAALRDVGGVGFEVTPLIDGARLIDDLDMGIDLSVKVDVGNVGGSHKARHLFGVALHMLIAERAGHPRPDRLAIASCGNAAIAAATVAAGLGRPLQVFVPTWAGDAVIETLDGLGADITRCERRPDEVGDPCYLRFTEAVAEGAAAFSVQGTDTPTTFDGGRTLGFEIAEQVSADVDALFVQVGGGALATSVGHAMPHSRLHPVQAEGCAPLEIAWQHLEPDFDFAAAAAQPGDYMRAWPDPHSFATGILDDVTYDWLPLLQQTKRSGGRPIVAPEPLIVDAWNRAARLDDVPVCSTGTAGLAGLLAEPAHRGEHVVVIFTGVHRG